MTPAIVCRWQCRGHDFSVYGPRRFHQPQLQGQDRRGCAPRDIEPGENWAALILHGIAQCRMMVLIFSSHTNSSNHIRREVERAVHRGIAIAPLRVQDAAPGMEMMKSSTK